MKLSEQLYNDAQELLRSSPEYVAFTMLKEAGLSEDQARLELAQVAMEKEAAATVAASGIDYDQALNMVKAAGIKVKDLATFKPELSVEEIFAEKMVKAAEQVFELEQQMEEFSGMVEKVASLQAQLEHAPEEIKPSEHITKLAQSGSFTQDDLQALMSLPQGTLEKVATTQEQPWRLGKSASMTAESEMDPILRFVLEG